MDAWVHAVSPTFHKACEINKAMKISTTMSNVGNKHRDTQEPLKAFSATRLA